MSASLFVDRLNLKELFSSSFSFTLPWYQRSYAWTDEHARCLLEDIRSGVKSGDGWYLLGPIILTRDPKTTAVAIIDGQQRLITLSILFAILRDLINDEELKKKLHDRLWQSASGPLRRIDPKEFIGQTLLKYVQESGATKLDPDDIEHNDFNDGERNIIENRNAMRKMLDDVEQAELEELALFLMDHCFLVVQTVEEERIAIHLFVKTQDSGLQLSPTDMLKVSVLNHVEPDERDDCALIWDSAAARLGNDGLEALLRHMCNIKHWTGQAGHLEIDLFKYYNIENGAKGFIQKTLKPMTDHAMCIARWSLGKGRKFDAVNRRLQYMSWIKHDEWRAPALHWLAANAHDVDATLDFLVRLERFAFIHMLNHTQIPKRNSLYAKVIAGIDNGTVLNDNGPLGLSKYDISAALKQLRRKKFFIKHYKTQVFLRANAAQEGDERVRTVPVVSIEHVYPKNPRGSPDWLRLFKDAAKAAGYVHRLGNLTPLTLAENGDAGSHSFEYKRNIYAGSPFKLSHSTAQYTTWSYDIINERTTMIINLLLKSFKLD